MNEKKNLGLYDKSFEHDNCGIGAVVNIKGVKIPTPSPVSPAASLPARCSNCSTIFNALLTVICVLKRQLKNFHYR